MPRRPSRILAAAALAALALSACSATTDGSDGGADADRNGPGVTDDTVKIGFVTLKNAAGGGGFVSANQGDPQAQVDAMVASINASGGIAGRQVTAVVKQFDSSQDSAQYENELCTAFTQDEKVFAVVLFGQREASARTCYQEADTVMLDVSGIALAASVYEGLAPHFWAPGNTTLDAYAASMVPVLKENGFFKGTTVGVLVEKDVNYQSVYESVLKPALEEAGAATIVPAEIDQTNAANAGATAGAAVRTMKSAGVTEMLFLGRPDDVGYFTLLAKDQKFFPRLGIGTFEDPQFASANPLVIPPESLAKAIGIGFSPIKDGVSASVPFPRPGAEADCIAIYGDAGITFAGRPEARTALGYCDSLGFLQAVGAAIGDGGALNADTIADAAADLGDSWQAASSLSTEFDEDVYAPASNASPLEYQGPAFAYFDDPSPMAVD